MTNRHMVITGMSCAACAKRIEKVVGRLDGVARANVNFASEKLTVQYDEARLQYDAIKAAVGKAGFGVVEEQAGVDSERERREREIAALRRDLVVAVAFGAPLFYLAMASMVAWAPFPSFLDPMAHSLRFALVQLALVVPVVVAGWRFYRVGFRLLWDRAPNMDSLIAVGTSAAVLYSAYSTYRVFMGDHMAAHGLYYESAGVIIALILLGKFLEAKSKGRTSEAIKKLMGLAPKAATVVRDGSEMELPLDRVEVGDVVLVKPGGKIPVDGLVLEGATAVDESMLTGESMPVDKKPGDKVYAATLNKFGLLRFRAEKIGADTALARIIQLVEDAQGSKAPIARLADVVAGYFVPAVIAVAVLSGAAWLIGTGDPRFALGIFISVLIIACPCALGLATPTAIMVGTGRGAESGILIKGGEALEAANRIDAVVMDKTGTITLGRPEVTHVSAAPGGDAARLLLLAASAEKGSEHPLAQAVVSRAERDGLAPLPVADFAALPGRGIEAVADGVRVLVGNRRLMDERGVDSAALAAEADRLADLGATPMFGALDGRPAGLLGVADVVKPTSARAVAAFRALGMEVIMLTGDNRRVAGAVAREVGIDRVLAEVLPGDKAEAVKQLQAEGKRVAMVGDGINDAPALARADVGIAIGSGADVAMESADIVLMRDDPLDAAAAVELSRATNRNIKENLFWAFAYNTAGIPVAAGVLHLFGGPLLNPMLAAAAMSLSSVSVLSNALRLRRFRPKAGR